MFSVRLILNSSYIPELQLLIGDFIKKVDVYFFTYNTSDEIIGKEDIIIKYKLLLAQWKERVENLESLSVTYLPFDFSDQYIGCIEVKKLLDNHLSLSYGATQSFEGWQISPDDIKSFVDKKIIYRCYTEDYLYSSSYLLGQIEKEISNNEY